MKVKVSVTAMHVQIKDDADKVILDYAINNYQLDADGIGLVNAFYELVDAALDLDKSKA